MKVAVAEDKLEQADFALKTATNITEYYEHYFGIKYPLPKQGKSIIIYNNPQTSLSTIKHQKKNEFHKQTIDTLLHIELCKIPQQVIF